MTGSSRRALRRSRSAALTVGVATALIAFLPPASAAPGLHPDWEPVLAGSGADPHASSGARQFAVARPDPDLDPATGDVDADDGSTFLDGVSLDGDGWGSDDEDGGGWAPSGGRATGTASPLAASGIPTTAMEAYTRAADAHADCGIDWTLLAAIGRVESNHGRFAGAVLHSDGLSSPPIVGIPLTGAGDTARITDTDGGRFDRDTVHDRAVGPMQFIPSTWAIYGSDGNGDGQRDPFNIHDAADAAAEYLCAAGKDLSTQAGRARAVLAYNHSDAYVATVLGLAATYAGEPVPRVPTPAGPAPDLPPVAPARPPALPAGPVVVADQQPVVPPAPQVPAPQLPEQLAPELPPAPAPQLPEQPAPEQPAPEAPETPAPETPAPVTPETPAPETPAPETPAPTPTPTPTPPGEGCETAPATALTVDLVDGTGDPALAQELAAALTEGGLTVGAVTAAAESVTSGIEHPEGDPADAEALAGALGLPELVRAGAGARVTVVLGSTDSAALVEALRGFTGLPCAPAEAQD